MLLLGISLYGFDIDRNSSDESLLEYSQIYIDKTQSLTFQQIKDEVFEPSKSDELTFGYSPKLIIWIKLELTNLDTVPVNRILEYDNPLTSEVSFYEQNSTEPIKSEGLLLIPPQKININPTLQIHLHPHENKTIYIRAYSKYTTLIVKLKLWSAGSFQKHESSKQIYLALFFGAMGVVVLYNLMLYLVVRDRSYLYYVLFFASIMVHQLFYRGVVPLFVPPFFPMENIIQYSSLIVATPALFLAIFMKKILNLKSYPHIEKMLNAYLVFFIFGVLTLYLLGIHKYRILSAILFLILLVILIYAIFKHNRHAYYLAAGWLLFLISGIFMYLSSKGYYNVFKHYPYYVEISLIVESLIFSYAVADKIKRLHAEKSKAQKELIDAQKLKEGILQTVVDIQTEDLQKSIRQKELLLRELNHRVKNSIQTIISFLRMEQDSLDNPDMLDRLKSLENRVFAINHLYSLLHTDEHIEHVDMNEYLTLLIESIKQSYKNENINIELNVGMHVGSTDALYLGFIINEALTNAYKYAFEDEESGKIVITLTKDDAQYRLHIKDNGGGYKQKINHGTLGHKIIKTLVEIQLEGELQMKADKGTEIDIVWKSDE